MSFATGFQDLPPMPAFEQQRNRPRQASTPMRVLRKTWVVQTLGILLILGIWELIALSGPDVPHIADVVSFMLVEISGDSHGGMLNGEFWAPLWLSLQRYGIGLAIGVPVGAVLGLLIGTSVWARGLLNDSTLVLLALPAVVWAFLASLWFGLTSTAPVVAVALTAIPFTAINLSTGVRNIDPALVQMTSSFRVPRRNQLIDLLLGGTLADAFTGVRLAIMTGWNSLLIVEWFGQANVGVGGRARQWFEAARFEGFVGWIFLFVLFITLIDRLLLRRLERYAFQWRQRPTLTFGEEWGL